METVGFEMLLLPHYVASHSIDYNLHLHHFGSAKWHFNLRQIIACHFILLMYNGHS